MPKKRIHQRHVELKFDGLPKPVQKYFGDFKSLIAHNYAWDIILAYLFMEVERGQHDILYGALVKKYKVDKDYARDALDLLEMKRPEFRELYHILAKKQIEPEIISCIERAVTTRNKVIHGKDTGEGAKKEAIMFILEYAHLLNEQVYKDFIFKPFGNKKGFKGRGVSYNKKTSGWVIEGILSRLNKMNKDIKEKIAKQHDAKNTAEEEIIIQAEPVAQAEQQEPPNDQ